MTPTILFSFPRSGNTWIRYCVEYFTKRLTKGAAPKRKKHMENGIGTVVNIGVNLKNPFIMFKYHKMPKIEVNTKPLILLVRNYKEVLLSHLNRPNYNNLTDKYIRKYVMTIQYFNNWAKTKEIIYYEDIINNLKECLIKIFNIIKYKYDEKELEDFLKNVEHHRRKCLNVYQKDSRKPITRGEKNKLIYHSNKLNNQQKHLLDERIKNMIPNIYDKYLKRYEEK